MSDLSALVMGFDADPEYRPLAGYLSTRDELCAAGADVMTGEIALIGLFADVAELRAATVRPTGTTPRAAVHSDREHFHRYLQSLDAACAWLTVMQFTDRLGCRVRPLRHHRADPEQVEEAVFRIFLAQRFASDRR